MTILGNKNSLWFCQRSFDVHALIESQSEQRYRQPVFPSPCGKTLGFSAKLDKALSVFVGSVSCMWLRRERLFNRPAVSESPRKIAGIKSKFGSPGADVLCLSGKLDIYVGGNVGLLLSDRCPATVFWKVAQASIDPVYGCPGWALTHVSKEVFKGFTPPIANSNSNSSVSRISWTGQPVAASEHVLIGAVSRALSIVRGVSVFWLSCLCSARLTAIFCKATLNPVTLSKKLFSAVKTSHVFGSLGHGAFLIHCNKLIVAYKARVAGVLVALPGLTKRRAAEQALCLEGA